jgi:HEAT repeat protein
MESESQIVEADDLETRIHKLGALRNGRLVRIAYHLSLGMSQKDACKIEDVEATYLHNPSNILLRQEVLDLASALASERIANAQEQATTLLRDGATEAVLVLLKQLRHPKATVAAAAANSILDRLGVRAVETTRNENVLRIDLGAAADNALQRIYGEPVVDMIEGEVIENGDHSD